MPASTQILPFPVKGINRTLSRSTQPDLTAYDMLNVIPFYPGTDRLVGGKRWGTNKVWANAIGDGIILLDQVTFLSTAADPAASIFTEPFTFANGEIHTATSSKWSQEAAEDIDGGSVLIISNQMGMNGRASKQDAASSFLTTQPAYSCDKAYTLEFDATLTDGSVSTVGDIHFGIILETAEAYSAFGPDAIGAVQVYLLGNGAGVFTLNTQTDTDGESDIPVTITSGVQFHMKIQVALDRSLSIFIDSVAYPLVATTLHAVDTSKRQIAFRLETGSSSHAIRVDNVTLVGTPNPVPAADPHRETHIVSVSSRDVIVGDIDTQGTVVTSGNNVVQLGVTPQGTYLNGKYYIVDGSTNILQVNLSTLAMETFTASAGTATANATLTSTFRGRLYLGKSDGTFAASRIGDAHDWDFSASDPAGAFDGAASTAGRISDTLTAFMPLGDDLMGLGGDHTLHLMRGDLKAGGSIDLVSNQCGVFGPKAWTTDTSGIIYFVGSGGLYRWERNGKPECISNANYNQFFTAIDRSRTVCTLVWDTDHQGLHLFFYRSGVTILTAPTHLWYDDRTQGLFPQQMPIGHGPPSAILYDGDTPEDRRVLLGGRDGYLRSFDTDPTNCADDGSTIQSYVTFGPFPLGDSKNDGIIGRVDLTLGNPPTGLTVADMSIAVTLNAGLTAYDVTEGSASAKLHTVTRTYAGQQGRVTPLRAKCRGVFGVVTFADTSADKTWSFEQMAMDIEPAGMTRR